MANYCAFDMRITGPEASIKEFVSMLRREGQFEHAGLGRTYSFDVEDKIFSSTGLPGIFQVDGFGDCAWSVLTAMQKEYRGELPSLESETERLGLVVEVYSSEPGVGFQEHILIAKGDVIYADCVDYEEHYIEGADSLEAYNEENDTDFTEDMINDDGDVCIGGFDNFGVFEDVSKYFNNDIELNNGQRKLERIISDAQDKLNSRKGPGDDGPGSPENEMELPKKLPDAVSR